MSIHFVSCCGGHSILHFDAVTLKYIEFHVFCCVCHKNVKIAAEDSSPVESQLNFVLWKNVAIFTKWLVLNSNALRQSTCVQESPPA